MQEVQTRAFHLLKVFRKPSGRYCCCVAGARRWYTEKRKVKKYINLLHIYFVSEI